MNTYRTKTEGEQEQVWSVLHGKYKSSNLLQAVHIFPLLLGQRMMTYIFGPDAKEDLDSPQNGLILPKNVERAFSNHQVVIVPSGELSQCRWKFLVVGRDLWTADATDSLTFENIHDTELKFEPDNEARPSERYLYYQYILALLVIARVERRAIQASKIALEEATTPSFLKAWTTPGKYLRTDLVRGVVEKISRDWPDLDLNGIMDHANDDIPDSMEEMVQSACEVNL